MTEHAAKWLPVPDIDSMFGSISFSFERSSLSVTMNGARCLELIFTGIVALRYEDECPGFDPLPKPLPMLREHETFPLLKIEQSRWLEQFDKIYFGRCHFALVSSDDLIQVIAKPDVFARWK
jgi:hypothetical protein